MDRRSAVEILANEAHTSEILAVRHCAAGDHRQAAWRFDTAGDYYAQAGDCLQAARCYAQAHMERQWVRPCAPTNVSALVD